MGCARRPRPAIRGRRPRSDRADAAGAARRDRSRGADLPGHDAPGGAHGRGSHERRRDQPRADGAVSAGRRGQRAVRALEARDAGGAGDRRPQLRRQRARRVAPPAPLRRDGDGRGAGVQGHHRSRPHARGRRDDAGRRACLGRPAGVRLLLGVLWRPGGLGGRRHWPQPDQQRSAAVGPAGRGRVHRRQDRPVDRAAPRRSAAPAAGPLG